jgi:hypothetical protein
VCIVYQYLSFKTRLENLTGINTLAYFDGASVTSKKIYKIGPNFCYHFTVYSNSSVKSGGITKKKVFFYLSEIKFQVCNFFDARPFHQLVIFPKHKVMRPKKYQTHCPML